jgi:hypothetical protein
MKNSNICRTQVRLAKVSERDDRNGPARACSLVARAEEWRRDILRVQERDPERETEGLRMKFELRRRPAH